jgi:hypothetical protein
MATPTQIKRRGRWSLILGTIFAFVAFAAVAYADNLQADLNTSTGGLDKVVELGTLPPNSARSQDVFLYVDEQPSGGNNPTYPFSVSGSKASASTFGGSVAFSGVMFSGAGTANGKTGQITWTTPAAQATAQNYSVIVNFDATSDVNESPATVTINFSIAAAPSDSTPPNISYVLDPASPDGDNGWYKSNVSLTWTVTDGESAISSTTGCDNQNITADQAATTYSCSATSAGGSAGPVNVSIKRDATNPTISGSVLPASPDGANSWYKTAPTVSFTCGDLLSLIASCVADGTSPASASKTLGESVSAQTVGGWATDNAGNTNTASVSGLKVDLSDPSVDSWVGGPAAGASYVWGSVPGEPTCTGSDAISGLASCVVTGYNAAVGQHTMTATATDNAGRIKTAPRSYTVLAWTLGGFFQPVDINGVYNTVKGGSTVPLKFEVFAGPTELTDTSAIKSFVQTKVNCDGTAPMDEIEVVTTGGTSLRYDATAGQFIQNWQTPRAAGTCYRVTMTTQDGSSLVALFRLK